MTKVGNIQEGKTPKYEDVVDATLREESHREARRMERPGLPDRGFLRALQPQRVDSGVARVSR